MHSVDFFSSKERFIKWNVMIRENFLDNDIHIPMVNDKFSSNKCQTFIHFGNC